MIRTGILLATTIALIVGSAFAAQRRLQPGQYEQTMEISHGGETMPPITARQCITQHTFDNLSGLLGAAASDQDCKISNQETVTDRMTFVMSCNTDGDLSESTADFRFATNAYTATVTTKADGEVFVTRLTGKRIGACEKE